MPPPSDPSKDTTRAFLEQAIRLAVDNVAAGGGPFGAIVVRRGEVIARGANRVTAEADPTAHAEVVAIREACRVLGTFQLDGCDVYSSAEPCPMCMGALYWARPDRVFFASDRAAAAAAGFDDRFIYDELARTVDARDLDTRHVEVEGAGREFDAWASNPDRTEY
ncbi:MAG: nucleoside deaminase [Gemmatimonadetes bacterium]|nr:nucleoside deaminase [Gemmatimonadota bacterium]